MNSQFKNIILIPVLLLVITHNAKTQGARSNRLITIHSNIAPADSTMMIDPVIVGPTIEFSLSNTLSWATCLQYNTRFKNFDMNSRLQWRFRLRSDIYLLYTDNYLADGPHRERNIELKIRIWLN